MREAIERIIAELEECYEDEIDNVKSYRTARVDNLASMAHESAIAYKHAIDKLKAVLADDQIRSEENSSR